MTETILLWAGENGRDDLSKMGDWNEKDALYGRLRERIERAHAQGQRVLLRLPVCAVGEKTKDFEELKDYCLKTELPGALVPDARWCFVRTKLKSGVFRAVAATGADGVCRDFYDAVREEYAPPLVAGMDYESVTAALKLMAFEIRETLAPRGQETVIAYIQPGF